MDGILNLYKPKDQTSFALVRVIRRLSGEKRVGHSGTLDPLAVGVLPIFLGKATRIIQYLEETAKTYHVVLTLGVTTDTYDRDGTVTATKDAAGVTLEEVDNHLDQFRGAIKQTPPMYSAVHHDGRRLYELARAGIEVERPSREVTVHDLQRIAGDLPQLSLRIVCSKGTYIRSIVHDLGQALGCGAVLDALVREQTGPFHEDQALRIDEIETRFAEGRADDILLPVDHPVASWPALRLSADNAEALRHGRPAPIGDPVEDPTAGGDTLFWPSPATGFARAYHPDGRFLAIVTRVEDAWRSQKVFL